MTNKINNITKYFTPISLEEYRGRMAAAAQKNADPQGQADSSTGRPPTLASLRIASINTNGTQKVVKKYTAGAMTNSKAKALEIAVKKLKLDAVFTQELRTGSWSGKLPGELRVYESLRANLKARGREEERVLSFVIPSG